MRTLIRLLAAATLATAVSFVAAAEYPARAVRIVIPYASGGGVDAAARLVAGHLSKALGQNFVVDAKPGGATVIGTDAVARAAPDGHTLLIASGSTMSLLPLVHPTKLPFDPLTDFAPIGMVSRMPFFLVASSGSPYRSVAELMADAKARTGQLAYASNGVGSTVHVSMAKLAHSAGVEMIHVPYPGFAPALLDVVTGRVAMTMSDLAPLKAQLDAGALRVLAVGSAARSRFLPEVPTLAEAGYPDNEFEIWLALFAPAGTPPAIVSRLGVELRSFLASPEAREAFARLGHEADPSDAAAVTQRITNEQKSFAIGVEAAGLAKKP